jgi:hypothetical protein
MGSAETKSSRRAYEWMQNDVRQAIVMNEKNAI